MEPPDTKQCKKFQHAATRRFIAAARNPGGYVGLASTIGFNMKEELGKTRVSTEVNFNASFQ